MIKIDAVRDAALRLPRTSERAAPRSGHPQFMVNDKCFAEAPADAALRVWDNGEWQDHDLRATDLPTIESALLAAWRQRAKKTTVAGYDYARGREDLADVFAELRTWPELTERGVGDFKAGGRAFLHFHHYETSRHADVKSGLGWGDPIPFPLGRPSPKVVAAFVKEVRKRLDITLDAVAAAKRK